MVTVADILRSVEAIAPPHTAWSQDRIGLLVGDPAASVSRVVVTFDASLASFEFAKSCGAELVVAHHPVIWDAPKRLTPTDYTARRAMALLSSGLACIAAHTNWDACHGGLNDFLAEQLGLSDVQPVGGYESVGLLKLTVFTPVGTEGQLIDALSAAGAGQVGLYQKCAYRTAGTGQFEALAGANPTVGAVGQLHEEPEVRIEMVLPGHARHAVEAALRVAHPYEEPAYDFVLTDHKVGTPMTRMGTLPAALTPEEFARHVSHRLGTAVRLWGSRPIQKVAVCGGAADESWRDAQRAGADVLVTGEVKQHNALEASEAGFCIVEAGHYATEHPSMASLMAKLQAHHPEITWSLFEPAPGQAGRPIESLSS